MCLTHTSTPAHPQALVTKYAFTPRWHFTLPLDSVTQYQYVLTVSERDADGVADKRRDVVSNEFVVQLTLVPEAFSSTYFGKNKTEQATVGHKFEITFEPPQVNSLAASSSEYSVAMTSGNGSCPHAAQASGDCLPDGTFSGASSCWCVFANAF